MVCERLLRLGLGPVRRMGRPSAIPDGLDTGLRLAVSLMAACRALRKPRLGLCGKAIACLFAGSGFRLGELHAAHAAFFPVVYASLSPMRHRYRKGAVKRSPALAAALCRGLSAGRPFSNSTRDTGRLPETARVLSHGRAGRKRAMPRPE